MPPEMRRRPGQGAPTSARLTGPANRMLEDRPLQAARQASDTAGAGKFPGGFTTHETHALDRREGGHVA